MKRNLDDIPTISEILPIFDSKEESIYKSSGIFPTSIRKFALFWLFPLLVTAFFSTKGWFGFPTWLQTTFAYVIWVLYIALLLIATEYLIALGISKLRASRKVTTYGRLVFLLGLGALGALFLRLSVEYLWNAIRGMDAHLYTFLGLTFTALALVFLVPPSYGLFLMWRARATTVNHHQSLSIKH